MSKKAVFYTIFFSLLVVGFFFLLSSLMPTFTKPKVVVIGNVQPFRFTNQDGKTVTEEVTKGKVVAVNFFFTTCAVVCPKMNGHLKPIYEAFKNEPNFLMLSHTSDPERDSTSVLKRYADSMQVNTDKWVFLTGRKDSLYQAARHSYKIDDPKNYVSGTENTFMHTQFIALVNPKGQVIEIYDGLRPSEVRDMESDIRKLLKEN